MKIIKIDEIYEYRINNKIGVIYKLNKQKKVYEKVNNVSKQIEEKIKKIELVETINMLKKNLTNLINLKRQELKDYIVGFKIDEKQEEAYELKYQIAKRYLDTATDEDKRKLQSEADLRELSVDDLAKLIVKKHDKWVSELEIFSQKIELFRIAFNDLLANEKYDKAEEVLENAKELNINSTDEDILNLFK